MTQSLAAGHSSQEQMAGRYRPVGISNKELHKPLNRCFWQAIGRYAAGKSRLIQTNEHAVIINTDETPTTTPNPKAEIWPGLDAQGRAIDTDGSVLVPTWPRVVEVVDHICRAAREQLPGTPQTVVFDSFPSLVKLAQNFVTCRMMNESLARQQSKNTVELADITPWDFKALHGQTAWGLTYDLSADLIHKCLHSNLGVGIVVHCDMKPHQVGVDKNKEPIFEERPALSLSQAMRDRYYRSLDFSFYVDKVHELETETVEGKSKTVRTPSGQEIKIQTDAKTVSVTKTKTRIITARADLAQYLKARQGLPDTFDVDTWSDLEEVYNTQQEPTP